MSTNSITLAHVTTSVAYRDAVGMRRYRARIKRATRATLAGDDAAAAHQMGKARKIAHAESHRGHLEPLIDLIDRQL